MFGSMPCTRIRSRPTAGGLARASRVVGQVSLRARPSVMSTTGRVTWKS
jgi:hypothetical protein